jgi:hypothetical protein
MVSARHPAVLKISLVSALAGSERCSLRGSN